MLVTDTKPRGVRPPKSKKVVAKAVVIHVGDSLAKPIRNPDEWSALVLYRYAGDGKRPEAPDGHDLPGGVVSTRNDIPYFLRRSLLVKKVHEETGLTVLGRHFHSIAQLSLPLRPGYVTWEAVPVTKKQVVPTCHNAFEWVKIGELDRRHDLPDWMSDVIRLGADRLYETLNS
jgi:hypothetical protein